MLGMSIFLMLEERLGAGHEFFPDGGKRLYKVRELLEGVRREARRSIEGNDQPASILQDYLVILLHGIRTRAIWQDDIRKALESKGFIVEPTNYGYFDIFRFLLQWNWGASGPIHEIHRQIRHHIGMHKGARVSIIAHSLGTFVVSKILEDQTDLKFNRIISAEVLCHIHFVSKIFANALTLLC